MPSSRLGLWEKAKQAAAITSFWILTPPFLCSLCSVMLYIHGHAHTSTPVNTAERTMQTLDVLCDTFIVQIPGPLSRWSIGWDTHTQDDFLIEVLNLCNAKWKVLHQFCNASPRILWIWCGTSLCHCSFMIYYRCAVGLQEIGTALTCSWIVVETVFCWKQKQIISMKGSRFRDVQYAICYHNTGSPDSCYLS